MSVEFLLKLKGKCLAETYLEVNLILIIKTRILEKISESDGHIHQVAQNIY